MDIIEQLLIALDADNVGITVNCAGCKYELTVTLSRHNIVGGCIEFCDDGKIKISHKECW